MKNEELLFVGEERQKALRRLKRAYDAIAASAQAKGAEGENQEPVHKVVLIEAERGLGKTRLAMELYRHLSTKCDPDDYWPDAFGRVGEVMHVMPKAEEFNYERTLPFLWWGLGVQPSASVGSTLHGSLPDLLPHLVSARIAAGRTEKVSDVKTAISNLVTDFGIEVSGAALDLAGLGFIKSVGNVVFKIGKALDKGKSDGPNPIGLSREPLETLTDTVIEDLATLFNPKSDNYAGVPLVVFVDDAQFSESDSAVAALVKCLIERSTLERWPMLLILTHWGRQMQNWTDGEGKEHAPSPVARELDDARARGGRLPEGAFLRLDLSKPVDDLGKALHNHFHGLIDDDVKLIAEKAGGNPRKLEQIIAKMKRKPKWFKDKSLDNALTNEGRIAVMQLADLDILDVVVDRFADTPQEVRKAMLLASLMGNQFVCDLVDRLAEAQLKSKARDFLKEGEESYRFLRDVVDNKRDDIASFNEQLFWEAANEYRDSGTAKNELENWSDDKDLFAALDKLLENIVTEPQNFNELTQADQAEALSLASERMKKNKSKLAGLALARLVLVEEERSNPEGAYSAAQQFFDGFSEGNWTLDDIPPSLAGSVAQTLFPRGNTTGAQIILESLCVKLKKMAATDPFNADWQLNLSITYGNLGALHRERGEFEAAWERYKASLDILQKLVEIDPTITDWQLYLSITYGNLGALHQERGELEAAWERYEASLDILQKLVEIDPTNTDWQEILVVLHNQLMEVQDRLGICN